MKNFGFLKVVILALLASGCAGATPELRLADGGSVGPRDKVTRPQVVSQIWPEYPPELRAARVEGAVELEFIVTPEGGVSDIRILSSSDPAFAESIVKAVRRWRFEAATVNGRPRASYFHLSQRFTLQ